MIDIGARFAGAKINIHTDSDALNSTPDAPLKAGVHGSASSSTEIAADGHTGNSQS